MKSLQRIFYYLFLVQIASIIFSIAVAQLLYALLLFVSLMILFKEKDVRITSLDIIVLMFFLLRIITILLSEFPASSSLAYFREVIFYPYYFIAVYFIGKYEYAGMKTVGMVLLFSAIVPSLYALFTVASGMVERGASFSGGYSVFAVHLAFVISFAAAMILAEENHKKKYLMIGAVVIIFAALLSTYTRSMWIGAILCLLLFGYFGYTKRLFQIVIAVSLLIGSVPSLRERFLTLLNPAQNSSGRIELWSIAMDRIPFHPYFGFGPESFSQIIGDRSLLPDRFVGSWHNEFLQIQIESGMIAAVLLLVIYAVPVWLILSTYTRSFLEKKFSQYFILFSLVVILPAILFGSIMLSILNGMILKFVLAGYSFIGSEAKVFKQYRLWSRT